MKDPIIDKLKEMHDVYERIGKKGGAAGSFLMICGFLFLILLAGCIVAYFYLKWW